MNAYDEIKSIGLQNEIDKNRQAALSAIEKILQQKAEAFQAMKKSAQEDEKNKKFFDLYRTANRQLEDAIQKCKDAINHII